VGKPSGAKQNLPPTNKIEKDRQNGTRDAVRDGV